MSHTSEPEDLKPDLTKKSDESVSTPENHDQQKGSETAVSEALKQTESTKNAAGFKEDRQQKEGSFESGQRKRIPAQFSQEKTNPKESRRQNPWGTTPKKRSRRTSSEPKVHKIKVSASVRQIVIWTMTGFFDFNPRYFIEIRGLTNILHISLSLTDVILLCQTCQLKTHPQAPSEGFYCNSPETFLFIISCSTFLTSVLYLISCLLSKCTDMLLFQSSFEVSYFVLYFILLLTASLTLIVSELNWGTNDVVLENDYDSSEVAAIIGLINSIMYGISAVWFFLSHRLQQKANDTGETEKQSQEEQ